jgi:hypothetical protein
MPLLRSSTVVRTTGNLSSPQKGPLRWQHTHLGKALLPPAPSEQTDLGREADAHIRDPRFTCHPSLKSLRIPGRAL